MTAIVLHSRLVAGGFTLTVVEKELVIDPEPPPELDAHLRLLHTGVRAIVAGKVWLGAAAAGARKPWVGELSPAELIPGTAGLLAVAGDDDGQWDRLPPCVQIEHPEVFEHPKPDAKAPAPPRPLRRDSEQGNSYESRLIT